MFNREFYRRTELSVFFIFFIINNTECLKYVNNEVSARLPAFLNAYDIQLQKPQKDPQIVTALIQHAFIGM